MIAYSLQTELVEPAVAGTRNVLRACSEAGVKRLVVVSSVAAVAMNPSWPKQDRAMDETCWTNIDHCMATQVGTFKLKSPVQLQTYHTIRCTIV